MEDETDFDDYGCGGCCCGVHGGPGCPYAEHEFVDDPEDKGFCLECGWEPEYVNHTVARV